MKTTMLLISALFLGIGGLLRADVVMEPPGSTVAGKTIAEWSTNWWRWAAALAPPGDPFTDSSGQFANVNQSGPVFFLAGSPGGDNSRRFEVPTNTYVLVPLRVGEWSQLELGFDKTALQIRQAAQQQANQIDGLQATLDGTAISEAVLFTHREESPDFNFVAVANNQIGINGVGDSGIAVADGFFLMLDPLTPGDHVLTYGGRAFGFPISETDTIGVGGPPLTPPRITRQPTSLTIMAGQTATFEVNAVGSYLLSYQWYFNGVALTNANADTLAFTAAPESAGAYWVTVSNLYGWATSPVAFLTVLTNTNTAVVVELPDATVAGKTIGEWTTKWWRWGLALAPPGDPFTDLYGQHANVNQSGPVFFMAGSPGGSRSRQFEVPTNTYLLVPLLVGELSQLELGFDKTAAQIRQAAQQQADQIDSLHATLDGVPIPQTTLFAHREVSPDFDFVAVFNNQLGVPPGASGIAVADGYFLMLDPLPPGIHVVAYGGGSSALGISISETDTITVGAPKITMQPTNQTVTAGQPATFTVGAIGSAPLSYQWYSRSTILFTNGVPIGTAVSNATTSTLTFTATPSSDRMYWVTVSNIVGQITSAAAFLTVTPPVILTSAGVSAGQFSFGVTGPSFSTVFIETSTNLSNWQVMDTNILSSGSNYFTILMQNDDRRFFRARRAP